MIRKIGGVSLLVLGWGLAASCARDDREVQLAFSNLGSDDAGTLGARDDGVALMPRLEVEPMSVDLGWVTMGFPSRARLRITNSGGTPLATPTIDWSSNESSDFELIQNQCSRELAPAESCEARVQLIPNRTGDTTAILRVESSNGGTAAVAMAGLGLEGGELILAPAVGSFENFGGVRLGATAEGSFTVSNPSTEASGPLAFQVNRPELSVLPPTGAAGECVPGTTSLVDGQSCSLRLAFTPAERGPLEATLTSRSDAVGSVSLTLAGRGVAPGVLTTSSATVDFDGVVLGGGTLRSVTFSNDGDEPLTLVGASLAPVTAEGFSIQNSDCGAGRVLAGGEDCSVRLEFRPPRVGEEMTAELIIEAVEGQQRQAVGLRGIGLEAGALTVAPVTVGEEDFGAVLLDGSLVRAFQVTNPTAQPSGVLTLRASDGFEVLTPGPGECVEGSTSLVDGESCTVRVGFTPLRRAAHDGSLTVSSALAGATSVPLRGQGIVAAAIEVEPEINFGRVFTNAPSSRTLVVRNDGDESLVPPSLELTSASDAQAMAFSYESTCTGALGAGEQCEITLRFAPTQPVPHSANLKLTAEPGGTAVVLLLAEALAPGSLVLAAAQGSSSDFGDVAVGSSTTSTFTLTHPGSTPSGRLTIRTDDSRFEAQEGDCNQGDPAGLVGGASCSFSVRFSPDTALEVVTSLSVQSAGAGQTGIELRGRGRSAATLTATGNRDLGRANLGQDTLTQPENEFTWTVSNEGDLPSGALQVTNDNPTEFEQTNDSCSNAQLAGRGSCQMTIRFRPSDAGARTASVVVTDPTSGRSATLVVTGVGVRLAALGQSCVNATCATGTCTGGVCCDRACDGTCQVCSAAGVCNDQSGREQCGNGAGRCFGVNRCLLPEGQACGQGGDCGNGNCERRLGGQGLNDRICCLTDCDATGQQCNAQGQCQQPTLAVGAVCGRAGDLSCGGGLECKACLGGGSRCTPANECCGGCQPGYECIDGDSCGCGLQANGTRMIDCGGGLCIQNRANACCPATPSCSAARPNCDPADNLCKECVNASQCPGTNRTCVGGVCGCAQGTKSCGDGRCIPNNQCCEACTGGRTCQGGTCGCPGANQQFVNGQCRLNQGAACTPNGTPCVSGSCVDGVCCESACAGLCAQCEAGTGRCVMPADDPGCPREILCAAPASVCQQTQNITTNRCQSLGQCKTAANCVRSNVDARTACGTSSIVDCLGDADCLVSQICDGSGACVSPTVTCAGLANQAVSANSCCNLPFQDDIPEVFNSDCEFGGSQRVTAFCDNGNDCPLGNVCCLYDFGNFNSISCTASCGDFTVCASPGGGTGPCPGGRACNRTNEFMPGWRFCAL